MKTNLGVNRSCTSNVVLANLRSIFIRRLGINESNRQEYFKKLMKAQIESKDINLVYKTINTMYTKRQANELTIDTSLQMSGGHMMRVGWQGREIDFQALLFFSAGGGVLPTFEFH